MGQRILPQPGFEIYQPPSRLCPTKSGSVRHATAELQGRCAGGEGGQRGVGQLFSRHETV